MRAFPVVLALLAVVLTATAGAQPDPIRFERATTVEAALPQSSVYAVVEDQRGFLWFGTREGLGRWDGHTMRTWRRSPFDTASLPGNLIRDLVIDDQGDLWARTEATDWAPTGVARLVGPSHDDVRRYGYPDAAVFVGPDGEAWLADSTEIRRFDRARDTFVHVSPRLHASRVTKGFASRDGTVWLTASSGLEAYPAGEAARDVPTDRPWAGRLGEGTHFGPLAEDARGTLWVGGSRLGRLTGDRSVVRTLDLPVTEIEGYGVGLAISNILPDPDGLWLSTLNGALRYRHADRSLARHSLRLPGDVPTQNWVTGFHQDRAGTVWAGTVWGLHLAAPSASPFRLIENDPDDANSLSGGIVLSVTRDARGALWVGTLGGGLNRIGPDGAVRRYRAALDTPGALRHDWIWSLQPDGDRLWVGNGEGVDAIDLDRLGTVERVELPDDLVGLAGPSASALALDGDGTLWFGHNAALHRHFADGTRRRTPTDISITSILPTPSGAWIAGGTGLARYNATEDAFHLYRHDPDDPASLLDNAAITLFLDRRDRLWVGTQGGLSRYDPEADGFVHFTVEDGLPSSVVYAIEEDDDGRLWIATNRGLARYDESSEDPFRTYTFEDGVGNVEFNRNASFRDADGTMYFGGDRGVTVFHPDDLTAPAQFPRVVVTGLRRSTREGTDVEPYVGSDGVTLAPAVTTFGFEFAALEFLHPHRIQYATRLDGWDDGWTETRGQRRVSYTNLPPGRYTFHVRATNADGVWGDEAAVPVVVRPAVHQTLWFRSLAALALLGLVAGVGWDVSRRRYRRELAALEARRALEAERSRISRDMHDEVGASLSEIAVLSEVARRQLGEADVTEERLGRIADSSRQMLDRLGQIVWAVNPRNDRLPALAGYLREHAARYLDAHELAARLRFPASVPDVAVSAEMRRTALLVLKEALHNAAKHAEATAVGVTFEVEAGRVVLTVRDDGRGFDACEPLGDGAPARYVGGNGLGNMAQRAADVGGMVSVTSAPGEGCTVRLTVPLADGRSLQPSSMPSERPRPEQAEPSMRVP